MKGRYEGVELVPGCRKEILPIQGKLVGVTPVTRAMPWPIPFGSVGAAHDFILFEVVSSTNQQPTPFNQLQKATFSPPTRAAAR